MKDLLICDIYICIIIFMNSVYIIFMEIIEFGFCKI